MISLPLLYWAALRALCAINPVGIKAYAGRFVEAKIFHDIGTVSDSHNRVEKPFGFPAVPTGPTSFLLLTRKGKSQAMDHLLPDLLCQ
jgi:hypothetical protein